MKRHRKRLELLPLLVRMGDGHGNDVELALDEAGVRRPLPVIGSLEAAAAYLQSEAPFQDRDLHAAPGVLLFELSPGSPGAEVLRWIRNQPGFGTIPIVVLCSSSVPKEMQDACVPLSNSFLLKPASFDALVAMLRSVDQYWTRLNIAHYP